MSWHFLEAAVEARQAVEPHVVTYVDFLTVTLTALAVILAAVTVVIASLAIWGYVSLREGITKSVTAAAEERIAAKIAEYPEAKEFHNELQQWRLARAKQAEQDRVRSRLKGSTDLDEEARGARAASKRRRTAAPSAGSTEKYPGSGN